MPNTQVHYADTKVSKSVVTALLSNLSISILKFIGYLLSRSPSMLAESIHSFADTANQFFLLLGEKTSSLKSTKDHPYGRGNLQYLFNFISAMGIFFVGCSFTIYHSFTSFLNPSAPAQGILFYISVSILVVSFIVEGYSLLVVIKEINEQKDDSFLKYVFKGPNPTLSAIFLEDFIAVLGVVLALIGQILAQIYQSTMPDSFFGMLIGLFLGVVALFLSYVNAQHLIGKSYEVDTESEIKEFLESFPLIQQVNKLKTKVLKPNVIAITAEVKMNGSGLFHNDRFEQQLERDCEVIQELMLDNVDDKERLKREIIDIYERSYRMAGSEIDKIQNAVKQKFPEVAEVLFEIE